MGAYPSMSKIRLDSAALPFTSFVPHCEALASHDVNE
jgi:hypothetical protein